MRRPTGLSLLEVVVGLGIFSVAILMVLGLFPMGLRAVDQGRGALLATHLAERELERVRETAFEDIESYTGEVTVSGVSGGADSATRFTYQVTVTPVYDDLLDVMAQVNWFDGGLAHYVRLETRVARWESD